jgi:hypothetical protein
MPKIRLSAPRVQKIFSITDSRWFDLEGRGQVYLRRSIRVLEDKRRAGLDFATVSVRKEFRRRGVCARALSIVEDAALSMQLEFVFVESIQNPIIVHMLERRGYTIDRRICTPYPVCGAPEFAVETINAHLLLIPMRGSCDL